MKNLEELKNNKKSKKYYIRQKLSKYNDNPKILKNNHLFYIQGKHVTRGYQMQW